MGETQVFEPSAAAVARTFTTKAQYDERYARSVGDPDGFWREEAKRVDWIKPPTKIKNTGYAFPNIPIKWFEGGVLHVPANCPDRPLAPPDPPTAPCPVHTV